jgi:pimeloyl-ACP methyl ester carboxylesterase
VLLQHGFARGPQVLDALAARLVAQGYLVVRPWIRSFGRRRGMTVPAHVVEVAAAAVALAPGVARWSVVGHSAGGAVAAASAAALIASGCRIERLVLVDPNESTTPMLVPGVSAVADAEGAAAITVLAAEPGRCNRRGRGPDQILTAAPGALALRIVGGTHCEIEGDAADVVCRGLCGGASDPGRTDLLHRLIADACAGGDEEPVWGSGNPIVVSGLSEGTLQRITADRSDPRGA